MKTTRCLVAEAPDFLSRRILHWGHACPEPEVRAWEHELMKFYDAQPLRAPGACASSSIVVDGGQMLALSAA